MTENLLSVLSPYTDKSSDNSVHPLTDLVSLAKEPKISIHLPEQLPYSLDAKAQLKENRDPQIQNILNKALDTSYLLKLTSETSKDSPVSMTAPSNEVLQNFLSIDVNNDKPMYTKDLIPSDKIVDFIEDYVKLSLVAYDTDGANNTIIGYGHLVVRKPLNIILNSEEFKNLKESDVYANGITKGEILHGITKERADQLFRDDLERVEKVIANSVKIKLTQNQYDALVSLIHNIGSFAKTPKLLRALNEGRFQDAAKEFSDITAGGLRGLVIRRQKEIDIFLNNHYDSRH